MTTERDAGDELATPPQARWMRRNAWWLGIGIALMCATYVALRYADSWLVYMLKNSQVRDVAALNARLQKLGPAVSEIGRVEYDGVAMPMLAVRRLVPGATRRLCVIAGVHGNEPAGVEAAARLAEKAIGDPALYPGLNLLIVPLANPWGWSRNLRHSGANQDINRGFAAGKGVEALIVTDLLARERCDGLVDLHGDRARREFSVITYDNPDLATAKALTAEVAAQGIALRAGMPDGVFTRGLNDAASKARPTLALYARQHGTRFVYVVESPRRLEFETRVRLHLQAIDRLSRSVGA